MINFAILCLIREIAKFNSREIFVLYSNTKAHTFLVFRGRRFAGRRKRLGICVEKSWLLQECWWLQSDCFGRGFYMLGFVSRQRNERRTAFKAFANGRDVFVCLLTGFGTLL